MDRFADIIVVVVVIQQQSHLTLNLRETLNHPLSLFGGKNPFLPLKYVKLSVTAQLLPLIFPILFVNSFFRAKFQNLTNNGKH